MGLAKKTNAKKTKFKSKNVNVIMVGKGDTFDIPCWSDYDIKIKLYDKCNNFFVKLNRLNY